MEPRRTTWTNASMAPSGGSLRIFRRGCLKGPFLLRCETLCCKCEKLGYDCSLCNPLTHRSTRNGPFRHPLLKTFTGWSFRSALFFASLRRPGLSLAPGILGAAIGHLYLAGRRVAVGHDRPLAIGFHTKQHNVSHRKRNGPFRHPLLKTFTGWSFRSALFFASLIWARPRPESSGRLLATCILRVGASLSAMIVPWLSAKGTGLSGILS
jgi:hypothetical protein